MLKPFVQTAYLSDIDQPPSGGCVLKLFSAAENWQWIDQPPSGGCVLKPDVESGVDLRDCPAAFRRLCVETAQYPDFCDISLPAAFRRLCVETPENKNLSELLPASRLQAAVC